MTIEELAERIERLEAKARQPRITVDEEIRPILNNLEERMKVLEWEATLKAMGEGQ
jgi:hypothetical protein